MIKKLIKSTILLAAVGFLTVPAFSDNHGSDGFSSSLAGNVRFQYDQETTKFGQDATGDAVADKKNNNMSIADGDTNIDYNMSYTSGETTASSMIRFYNNTTKRINLSASTKSGDWTGEGFAEWEESFNGNGATGTVTPGTDGNSTIALADTPDQRASYVKLSNPNLMYAKAGYFQPFDLFFKGAGNTFASEIAADGDVGREIDNRFDNLILGYANADIGIDVGVVYSQQTGAEGSNASNPFGEAVTGINNTGLPVAIYNNSTSGLIVNYKNADAVGLDLTFEYGTSVVTAEGGDRDPTNDGYKESGTHTALGVGLAPIEELTVGINYAKNVFKATDYTVDSEDSSKTSFDEYSKGGWTKSYLSIDYSLGDLGGVGLLVGSGSEAEKETTSVAETPDARSFSYNELTYKQVIAGVTMKVGYISETYTGPEAVRDNNGNLSEDIWNGGSNKRIRLRADYSF